MAKQDWSYQPKAAKLQFVSELPEDCISTRGRQTSEYMLAVIADCKALQVGKGYIFVPFNEEGENGIKPTQLVTLKNNLGGSFQVRAGTNKSDGKGVWVNRTRADETNEERKARIAARRAKEQTEQTAQPSAS